MRAARGARRGCQRARTARRSHRCARWQGPRAGGPCEPNWAADRSRSARQLSSERVDVAGAHHHAHVSGVEQLQQRELCLLEALKPENGTLASVLARRADEREATYAGMVLGALACEVDIEQGNDVGLREGRAELIGEQSRARVEMRLEDGHEPLGVKRS